MSDSDIEARVLQHFIEIAPDVDPADIKRELAFREQFDFDSMDTLNFAIALSKAFQIEIPETEYRQLASLSKTVAYVTDQIARKKPTSGRLGSVS